MGTILLAVVLAIGASALLVRRAATDGRLASQAGPESTGAAPSAPPRVGYLLSLDPDYPPSAPMSDAQVFSQGLAELGYVDGVDIIVEYRFARGQFDELPSLVDELIGLGAAVIVAADSRSMRAAQDATTTVPLVMTTSTDPVASGRIASLARPGGNITGLTLSTTPGLAGKKIELLSQAAPGTTRLGVVWQRSKATVRDWDQAEEAARSLGIDLASLEVTDATTIDDIFAQADEANVQALLVFGTPKLNALMVPLSSAALDRGYPLMGSTSEWVDSGALISYAPQASDLHRRAATYVDKILRGADPAELPVEQPKVFDLAINLDSARALGLAEMGGIMRQATRVVP